MLAISFWAASAIVISITAVVGILFAIWFVRVFWWFGIEDHTYDMNDPSQAPLYFTRRRPR